MFFRQLVGIFALLNAGYFLTADMDNPVLWMVLYIGLLSVVMGVYFYTRSLLPILLGGVILSGAILMKGLAENELALIVASAVVFFVIACVFIVVYWSAFLVRLGQPEWAIQHTKNLLSVMPDSAMLYHQSASLYRAQGRYAEALSDHQQALAITLHNPATTDETRFIYRDQLAQAYLAVIVSALLAGKPELAIEQGNMTEQDIEESLYWDDILFHVAWAHYLNQQPAEAKALWEQLPAGYHPQELEALKSQQAEFLRAMETAIIQA